MVILLLLPFMFTLIHGHELEEFAKNLQGVICQFSALDIIPAIIGPAEIMFCLLAASQNYQAIIENDNITRAFAGIGGLLEIGMVFNSIRSTTDLIYNKIKGSQETPYQEHQEEQSPINQESQLTKNTTCAAIICSSLIDAFTTACVSYKEGIKIPFWNVKPHNLVVATIGGLLNFMVHTAEGLYCDSNHQDEKPGNAITEACADVLKVRAL